MQDGKCIKRQARQCGMRQGSDPEGQLQTARIILGSREPIYCQEFIRLDALENEGLMPLTLRAPKEARHERQIAPL